MAFEYTLRQRVPKGSSMSARRQRSQRRWRSDRTAAVPRRPVLLSVAGLPAGWPLPAFRRGRCERLVRLALQTNQAAGGGIDPVQLDAAVYLHDLGMMFLAEGRGSSQAG